MSQDGRGLEPRWPEFEPRNWQHIEDLNGRCTIVGLEACENHTPPPTFHALRVSASTAATLDRAAKVAATGRAWPKTEKKIGQGLPLCPAGHGRSNGHDYWGLQLPPVDGENPKKKLARVCPSAQPGMARSNGHKKTKKKIGQGLPRGPAGQGREKKIMILTPRGAVCSPRGGGP